MKLALMLPLLALTMVAHAADQASPAVCLKQTFTQAQLNHSNRSVKSIEVVLTQSDDGESIINSVHTVSATSGVVSTGGGTCTFGEDQVMTCQVDDDNGSFTLEFAYHSARMTLIDSLTLDVKNPRSHNDRTTVDKATEDGSFILQLVPNKKCAGL